MGSLGLRSSLRDFKRLQVVELGDNVIYALKRKWRAAREPGDPSPEFLSGLPPERYNNPQPLHKNKETDENSSPNNC